MEQDYQGQSTSVQDQPMTQEQYAQTQNNQSGFFAATVTFLLIAAAVGKHIRGRK